MTTGLLKEPLSMHLALNASKFVALWIPCIGILCSCNDLAVCRPNHGTAFVCFPDALAC